MPNISSRSLCQRPYRVRVYVYECVLYEAKFENNWLIVSSVIEWWKFIMFESSCEVWGGYDVSRAYAKNDIGGFDYELHIFGRIVITPNAI